MRSTSRIGTVWLATVLIAACTGGQVSSAPTQPPQPTDPRPSAPLPTASPSATERIATLTNGGTMFPGTYRTKLDPPMTITIDDLVDLDCAPGYRCRGDIDLNTPVWVGFEFGNVHGSELDIMSIGKVYDADGKTLIDPPDDFVSWMLDRPGMHENAPRKAVTIGGIAGTRVDITDTDTSFPGWGPTGRDDAPSAFGINGGAGARVRFDVLNVRGHWVLIQESQGPDNTVHDFKAIVDGLQSVIHSIRWE
jgi:hypothetical protein